ncbi:cell envelope integrity protein TolA [Tamlana sp. s12]|uniref:cell envelope integrity protein TolA n=1 Tax=Tamlana sp. s12 TaxID=1630406 RepID=UPI0007FEBFDA|nr:cell envelope integrity protein TolA [Tamlana sp. s12]OBQ54641.1 hypothetical protein VQ01_10865 [Tamlana sp. s12]QQY82137.1 cell envelope integrity protein TolA [Tamlana sp. s12]
MIKYCYLFLFSLSLFSQNAQISTQFFQDGKIYKELNENLNELTNPIGQFSENEPCEVVDFLGRDNYKIKYNDQVGIVKMDDLEVTEGMMDLYYAYQEEERLKLIQAEEARKNKVYQISEKGEIDQRKQDSIEKRLANQKQIESALAIKHQNEVYFAKQKVLEEQRKKDSIAVIEAKAEAIKEQRVKDSIEKRLANQKQIESALAIKHQNEVYFAKQKALKEQQKQDSIALIVAKEKAFEEQRVKDTIQKNLAKQKEIEAALQIKRQNEVYLAKQKSLKEQQNLEANSPQALYEKQIKDSLIRSMAIQKRQYEKRIKDSLIRVLSAEKKSVTNVVEASEEMGEKERLKLERIKFKDSCSYEINDFDVFYNVHTMKTSKYVLNDVLTVELYRQGHKVNVFFNAKEDLGCVSHYSHNRSSVKVTLENGKNVVFYHSWNMECGSFEFKGNLSKSQIRMLQESPIASIKLKGTKGSVQMSEVDYSEFFIDKLKCIE